MSRLTELTNHGTELGAFESLQEHEDAIESGMRCALLTGHESEKSSVRK